MLKRAHCLNEEWNPHNGAGERTDMHMSLGKSNEILRYNNYYDMMLMGSSDVKTRIHVYYMYGDRAGEKDRDRSAWLPEQISAAGAPTA